MADFYERLTEQVLNAERAIGVHPLIAPHFAAVENMNFLTPLALRQQVDPVAPAEHSELAHIRLNFPQQLVSGEATIPMAAPTLQQMRYAAIVAINDAEQQPVRARSTEQIATAAPSVTDAAAPESLAIARQAGEPSTVLQNRTPLATIPTAAPETLSTRQESTATSTQPRVAASIPPPVPAIAYQPAESGVETGALASAQLRAEAPSVVSVATLDQSETLNYTTPQPRLNRLSAHHVSGSMLGPAPSSTADNRSLAGEQSSHLDTPTVHHAVTATIQETTEFNRDRARRETPLDGRQSFPRSPVEPALTPSVASPQAAHQQDEFVPNKPASRPEATPAQAHNSHSATPILVANASTVSQPLPAAPVSAPTKPQQEGQPSLSAGTKTSRSSVGAVDINHATSPALPMAVETTAQMSNMPAAQPQPEAAIQTAAPPDRQWVSQADEVQTPAMIESTLQPIAALDSVAAPRPVDVIPIRGISTEEASVSDLVQPTWGAIQHGPVGEERLPSALGLPTTSITNHTQPDNSRTTPAQSHFVYGTSQPLAAGANPEAEGQTTPTFEQQQTVQPVKHLDSQAVPHEQVGGSLTPVNATMPPALSTDRLTTGGEHTDHPSSRPMPVIADPIPPRASSKHLAVANSQHLPTATTKAPENTLSGTIQRSALPTLSVLQGTPHQATQPEFNSNSAPVNSPLTQPASLAPTDSARSHPAHPLRTDQTAAAHRVSTINQPTHGSKLRPGDQVSEQSTIQAVVQRAAGPPPALNLERTLAPTPISSQPLPIGTTPQAGNAPAAAASIQPTPVAQSSTNEQMIDPSRHGTATTVSVNEQHTLLPRSESPYTSNLQPTASLVALTEQPPTTHREVHRQTQAVASSPVQWPQASETDKLNNEKTLTLDKLSIQHSMPMSLISPMQQQGPALSDSDGTEVVQSNPSKPLSPIPAWIRPRSSEVPPRLSPEQTASQTGPTIRVTIGRVEVRTAVEAPTKPTARPQPRPALSLDAYLQRREAL